MRTMLSAAAFAAAMGACASASATIVNAEWTGTITSGFDSGGIFGPVGADVSGLAFTANFLYDTSLGTTVSSSPTGTNLEGGTGTASGGQSPISKASFAINGVTNTFVPNLVGQIVAFNGDPSFVNQIVHNAESSTNNQIFLDMHNSSNQNSGSIPGMIDVPLTYTLGPNDTGQGNGLFGGPNIFDTFALSPGLADGVPDANTIWTFREKADAIDGLFRRFDEALRSEGFLAMSGQIVDATIVATPKQCNTIEEQEEGDWQGRPHSRRLEGQACAKLAQKRPGCALDGQILQGEAARGWEYAGGRPRDPGVRLQEPCLDRSGLRPDPQLDDDARRRARRGAARRRSGPDKHGERRLGGYGLPVGEERSNARAARVGVAHPSQEAARPADA